MKSESLIEEWLLQDKRDNRSKMSPGISRSSPAGGRRGRRRRRGGGEEEQAGGAGRPRARLTRKQRELHRFRNMLRKDDFIWFERVKGHLANILAGLELHAGVFSTAEQKRIVCRRWASAWSLEVRLTYWLSSMKYSEFRMLDRMSIV